MTKVCLKFEDILLLLEFVEYTKTSDYDIDLEKGIVTGELSEADLELALHGYKASILER
jgi:hypothetical protein